MSLAGGLKLELLSLSLLEPHLVALMFKFWDQKIVMRTALFHTTKRYML